MSTSTSRIRQIYKFIEAHRHQHNVRLMCRVLGVAPSGYYEWLKRPLSNRAQEDARLLRLIQASFVASHGVYGAPRVFLDLREAGETCSKHRVARLMHENRLHAHHGYRVRGVPVSKPPRLIPNILQRQFWLHSRTRPGLRISLTSAPGRVGYIWRWSWICSPERSSVGPLALAICRQPSLADWRQPWHLPSPAW